MQTNQTDQSVAFLSELFRFKPPEEQICVWRLEGRRSLWISEPAKLPPLTTRSDYYFGVGTCKTPTDPSKRATSDSITGIPGVWADIDIQSAKSHKKHNLPESYADVEWLLSELDLPPSLLVFSGYGYHAYWQFSEWCSDIPMVAGLVQRFQAVLRGICESKGWGLDATHDLARVLRLPGTINHKQQGLHPLCEVKHASGALYAPEHIAGHLSLSDYEPVKYIPTGSTEPASIQLNLDRPYVDPRKLEVLRTNDERFDSTWKGDRPDLADQSGSGYDMAIANALVRAKWDDQAITDAVIVARLARGDKPKTHLSYYQTLLQKARESVAIHESKKSETEAAEALEAELESPTTIIHKYTNLEIVSVEQFGLGEDAYFTVVIGTDEPLTIRMGTATELLDRKTWQAKLFQFVGGGILSYKEPTLKHWKAYVIPALEKLRTLLTDQNMSIMDVVDEYLEDYINQLETNRDYALREGISFKDEGKVYLHLATFHQWVKSAGGIRELPRQRLCMHLRWKGWKPEKIKEGQLQRRYWLGEWVH